MPSRAARKTKKRTTRKTPSAASHNKAFAKRWFTEVWNQRRADRIDEWRAEEVVGSGLASGAHDEHGVDTFKAFHANLLGAFPDFHVTIEDMISENDKVAVRIRCKGTHKGNSLGPAPTGKVVEFSGTVIARVKNGKIVQAWNYIDFLSLLTQIGAVHDPVGPSRFLQPAK